MVSNAFSQLYPPKLGKSRFEESGFGVPALPLTWTHTPFTDLLRYFPFFLICFLIGCSLGFCLSPPEHKIFSSRLFLVTRGKSTTINKIRDMDNFQNYGKVFFLLKYSYLGSWFLASFTDHLLVFY